jgi:predicted transglutaminase-like cysteine proteinase
MDNAELKDALGSIHKRIFKKFTYAEDIDQYEMLEKWVMPDAAYDGSQRFTGDCEDFALACRKVCRESGIDNSRLVYCTTELGGGHCVLEVDGWILDNRHTRLMNRDKVKGYNWIALSGYNSGDPWKYINN